MPRATWAEVKAAINAEVGDTEEMDNIMVYTEESGGIEVIVERNPDSTVRVHSK